MPAAQRRKIFPHLDKEKPPTAAANSTKPDEKENYDNAKTSKKHPTATRNASKANGKKDSNTATTSNTIKKEAPTHHLLPLPLVLLVILCSGFHWISSFRDMMATGKPILDNLGIVLWGQSDADINLLVSFIPFKIDCHNAGHNYEFLLNQCIHLNTKRVNTKRVNTNKPNSNIQNQQPGTMIPADGNPNRAAYPPSYP
jgi:hypothetical protein